MLQLTLVRNRPGTTVGDRWTVEVPTTAEAHRYLGFHADNETAVSGYLAGSDGRWLGSGLAGGGSVRSDWA